VTLIVSSLRRLPELIGARSPSHLISLLAPSEMIEEHPAMSGRHLRLGVNDIVEPAEGLVAPHEGTVRAILDFAEAWDPRQPMLIHCWAGISRSSATAFIVACAKNPQADETVIADHLRAQSPIAHPNSRLVALADALLGREGRMSAAVHSIGPGRPAFENEPFELPARFVPT